MKSNLIAYGALFAVVGIAQTSAAPTATIGPRSTPEDVAAMLAKDSNLTQVAAWYKAGASEAVLITGVNEVKGKRGVLRVICPLLKVGADAKKVTSAAFLAGANPSKVIDAGSCQGASKAELISFAIQAGVDPVDLTASPAAGGRSASPSTPIQIGPTSTADDVADLLEQKPNLDQVPNWYKDGAIEKVLITGVADVQGKDGVGKVICPLVKVGADPRLVTIAAIQAGAQASKVVDEASCNGANKADLIAFALEGGADPGELTDSPAAGGNNAGSPPTTPPPGGGTNQNQGNPTPNPPPGTAGNNNGSPPITPPFRSPSVSPS